MSSFLLWILAALRIRAQLLYTNPIFPEGSYVNDAGSSATRRYAFRGFRGSKYSTAVSRQPWVLRCKNADEECAVHAQCCSFYCNFGHCGVLLSDPAKTNFFSDNRIKVYEPKDTPTWLSTLGAAHNTESRVPMRSLGKRYPLSWKSRIELSNIFNQLPDSSSSSSSLIRTNPESNSLIHRNFKIGVPESYLPYIYVSSDADGTLRMRGTTVERIMRTVDIFNEKNSDKMPLKISWEKAETLEPLDGIIHYTNLARTSPEDITFVLEQSSESNFLMECEDHGNHMDTSSGSDMLTVGRYNRLNTTVTYDEQADMISSFVHGIIHKMFVDLKTSEWLRDFLGLQCRNTTVGLNDKKEFIFMTLLSS